MRNDRLGEGDFPELNDRPSKSRLKRASAELEDLGKELLALPESQLERLGLSAELMDAVRLGQTITAHGGLRRQRKFIGKLLRGVDIEPIRQNMIGLRSAQTEATRLQHLSERWRDRMLAEGDKAINDFMAEIPVADRQKLRQWVRDGQAERQAAKPPRAARLLFRYLRELLQLDQGHIGIETGVEFDEP